MRHCWIVGTDTDVGKTFITTIYMRYLQKKGVKVIPYKPIQTGLVEKNGISYYHDTTYYVNYSLHPLEVESINSYSFPFPASPHYAAELEGIEIKEETIYSTIDRLIKNVDFVLCEGAGGLYVPLQSNSNITFLDVIKKSSLPVILVAHSKLGTINHTLLSVHSLQSKNIEIMGIILNRFGGSSLERDNLHTLKRFLPNIPLITVEENRSIESFDDEYFFERLMAHDIR